MQASSQPLPCLIGIPGGQLQDRIKQCDRNVSLADSDLHVKLVVDGRWLIRLNRPARHAKASKAFEVVPPLSRLSTSRRFETRTETSPDLASLASSANSLARRTGSWSAIVTTHHLSERANYA
ncbi:uncharacterized protein BP5553_09562 [Venustampulla echinocandica]|uniref:Uncharacterized protein n=1 Tax=Venustampulla echinocandica TaxID=2656787 RepID=A0A370TBD3_9HELO|nr:uncharacterized protein BP5553_09562 [Venustampulla echinocandica]RDL31353.1 hypothetical protein BP5553_09562 [Venustampulla echinocandica]